MIKPNRRVTVVEVVVGVLMLGTSARADVSERRPLVNGERTFLDACLEPMRVTLFDWNRFPDQSGHLKGDLGKSYRAQTLTDPVSRATISIANTQYLLELRNWVDAPGFGDGESSVASDFAVNDVESFTIDLKGCRKIGFGIITGKTNATPDQVDKNGAVFQIEASDSGG